MFSKICNVAVMLDYFATDSAFRCCLILDNEIFPDIASNSRPEGQTVEAKSKNCATKRKLSAFLSYLILKIKSVFSFKRTLHAATLTSFCYASNNSS